MIAGAPGWRNCARGRLIDMKTELTSRERVNRACNHQPHDRVPRYETFWDDTIRRWAGEGMTGGREQALAELGADLAGVSSFFWPSPYPGRYELLEDRGNTQVVVDEWGGRLRVFKDHQTTPEHLGWECDSPDTWHTAIRPRILAANSTPETAPCLAATAAAEREQKWRYQIAVEPFECLRKLIGDEETMIGLIEEPEWIQDMAEVTTSRMLAGLDQLRDAGVRAEGLWIYGDMAYNHATLCSPETYRELIWPQHRRMCEWAHARGMKVIYHTDGNVNGVLDLYVEAGIDVLQPLECKAGMDLRTLSVSHGSKLGFFGNIDVMVLIRGNPEEIEEEIRAKISAGMSTGAYLYHSDHSIPPQVSWPLYQMIIGWVKQYGDYA